MARKTKILIVGSSPILPTGLGETTRLIFGALLDQYEELYELHQVGLFNSYSVATPRWPVYPTKGRTDERGRIHFRVDDQYGQITFKETVAAVKPDIVFAFNDPQRIFHICTPAQQRDYKLLVYVTIDGMPFLPSGLDILDRADLLFTMSEFSTRVMSARLPASDPAKFGYMYGPADVRRFHPVTSDEKAQLRQTLFPEWMPRDAFVLGWVGRNQWRKQVWLLYRIIRLMREGQYLLCNRCERVTPVQSDDNPGLFNGGLGTSSRSCIHCASEDTRKAEPLPNLFLWIHMADEPGQAWRRSLLENQFDARPGRDIHYTGHQIENHLPTTDMPSFYQAWDAMLYLSGGEGFGVPAWEAMCTGIPAVYTNYSTHGEFLTTAKAGLPVRGTMQPEPETCIWRAVADIPEVIQSIRRLYFDRKLGLALGAAGRNFVEGFAPELQARRWHDVFQSLLADQSNAGHGHPAYDMLAADNKCACGTRKHASPNGKDG